MGGTDRTLELTFGSGEESLEVRRFSVREGLSGLFDVSVLALSDRWDVDLSKLVGHRARFALVGNGSDPTRNWSGVVAHGEQIQAIEQKDSQEQSTYFIKIVPELWITTQRRDQRIFQQLSIPDVVKTILDESWKEWDIKYRFELTKGEDYYKKHDYLVQYGETDFDFICRLLERAGITYAFRFSAADDTELVFTDAPEKGPRRSGGAIKAFDEPPLRPPAEYLMRVRLAHSVQPGKVTLRDYEFRRDYNTELDGKSQDEVEGVEKDYEIYRYAPGAFLVDNEAPTSPATPNADDREMFPRHVDKEGEQLATRWLRSQRKYKRRVRFETNLPDLWPGKIFTMRDHPRDELAEPLMVCSLSLEGTTGGEWNFAGEAAFASEPHVPDWCTPKPKIFGMQSAVVVGPPDEELHTDEHGRVRVQFPWDREGKHDDKSSCWLRVSQDWAGAGWGAVMLPRVGQEVLVGFYEGDPDHPVVVGRVYNENNPVPYELPKHKTKSTWKSDSSPAEKNPAGFNEIMFDDERGKELLYQQAELDRQKLVKAFETERTGRNRLAIVGNNRSAVVGELDATMVGRRHLVRVMDHPVGDDLAIQKQEEPKIEPTDACIDMHVESNKHNHIIFTTGTAKLALSKRHIRLEAKGKISLRAGAGDIIIEGKHVYLNTKTPAAAPDPQPYSPLEPGIFSYETEELALRFAEQTEIDLARSPGASAPQIEARKKLAAGFYRASYPKYSGDRIYSHLNGIDFDESVEEVEIPPRTTLEQYAYPVDPPKEPSLGNYFAPPGATPDELGLNPEGLNKDSGNVEPKPLLVVQSPATPTPALKSTAGPIVDDWSDPNNPYAASGGAEQFNVPDKEAMRPVPPSP